MTLPASGEVIEGRPGGRGDLYVIDLEALYAITGYLLRPSFGGNDPAPYIKGIGPGIKRLFADFVNEKLQPEKKIALPEPERKQDLPDVPIPPMENFRCNPEIARTMLDAVDSGGQEVRIVTGAALSRFTRTIQDYQVTRRTYYFNQKLLDLVELAKDLANGARSSSIPSQPGGAGIVRTARSPGELATTFAGVTPEYFVWVLNVCQPDLVDRYGVRWLISFGGHWPRPCISRSHLSLARPNKSQFAATCKFKMLMR